MMRLRPRGLGNRMKARRRVNYATAAQVRAYNKWVVAQYKIMANGREPDPGRKPPGFPRIRPRC